MALATHAGHDARWWVLAGCSASYEWTAAEARWATIEQGAARPSLPRAARTRLDGIVVDWDARADATLLKGIRPGDVLVVIAADARGRWHVEPPMHVRAKDTYWWPSMRRTSMLTVERPAPGVRAPLPRVLRALAKEGATLRRDGMQSHGVTSTARIAVLERVLAPESLRRLAR